MVKVENTPENIKKCICDMCPSYNDCMRKKKEKLYCAKGLTKCEFKKNGCLCMGCPVQGKYKLSGDYYCVEGKAK